MSLLAGDGDDGILKMKAQIIEEYSPEEPKFIKKEDFLLDISTLKDTQVLVNIKAASVNPADNHLRSGNIHLVFKVKFPCILGKDGSGIVAKVGSKVTQFKEGDEVCGCLPGSDTGTYAEYCVFEEVDLIKKPKEMTHQQAAAFPIVAGTVLEMYKQHPVVASLIEKEVEKAWEEEDQSISPPTEDEEEEEEEESKRQEKSPFKVLVIGASGGTGSMAILFAKAFLSRHFDVKVYGVCSQKNAEAVLALGADVVIDYNKTSLAKLGPHKVHNSSSSSSSDDDLPSICQTIVKDHGEDYVDLVLDCVGGYYFFEDVSRHLQCWKARPYTVFATIVPPGPPVLTVGLLLSTAQYMLVNWIKSFSVSYPRYAFVTFFGKRNKDLHFVFNTVLLAHDRAFERMHLNHFTLDQVKEAHELMASKRTIGKSVIEIQ